LLTAFRRRKAYATNIEICMT